ncbi:hypothetical protein BIV57_11245 [Mangrovactinospora gilvigrisea]|uniref:DUF2493 domain-containing protein n=2 Tax=Mangrovactinospora gilvigrisea TaxID=1428644 RepID=A0A1J7BV73_9ACTN|nr:hypothetical protein BIV57_11245 [Mangrovactinospora gilvigrisea]
MNVAPDSIPMISEALDDEIAKYPAEDLIGVTCLARGADTLFADAVVKAGGRLRVVLPSRDYRDRKVKPAHAPDFDRLIAAADVEVLPFDTASRDAYEAANEILLGTADHLIAVWDGDTTANRSGTSDVVARAQDAGLPVTVVWPAGAHRD